MAQSRWLYFTLALVALACDQNTPSGPSLTPSRLHPSATPQVAATEEDGTLTASGNDQVAYQTQFLPAYAYPLIADVSISGAVHFDGDTQFTPDHLASGDIGPAGILSGQTCMLRATVTFQNGSGLGAPGPCPTTPTGSQTISATELISGTPRFELQASTSTRNFCGPTTICITWSGSLQLTVVPEHASLTLSIDNAAVDSGTPVTVTAAADPPELSGIGVPISNLDWQLPDPNEACAGNSLTCTFTATRSGSIQVSAIVNGTTSTDAVSLTVRPKPDSTPHDSLPACTPPGTAGAAPGAHHSAPLMRTPCGGGGGGGSAVSVVCDPATPIRGTNVACKISVTPAAPFTVIGLEAAMDTATIGYQGVPVPVEMGGTLTWSGIAGLSTNVSAEVQVQGQSGVLTGRGGFTVTPRTWAPWSVPAPQEQDGLSPDGLMSMEPLRSTVNFEPHVSWRMAEYYPHQRTFNDPQWAPMTTITSGPNAGVSFFASWPQLEAATVYVNPQLTGEYIGTWYKSLVPGGIDQSHGNLPYCGQADVPRLLNAVRDHEGTTMLRSSHWGDYNFYASTSHIESAIEALTSHGDAGKVILGDIADGLYEQLVIEPYHAAGNARDTQDAYTLVLEAAGCSPLRP